MQMRDIYAVHGFYPIGIAVGIAVPVSHEIGNCPEITPCLTHGVFVFEAVDFNIVHFKPLFSLVFRIVHLDC
jgi:hypothetical protein